MCLTVAIGAVMVAIAAIVASYITAGAAACLKAISTILNKCGVALMSISPVGFGHMVFEMYDDFVFDKSKIKKVVVTEYVSMIAANAFKDCRKYQIYWGKCVNYNKARYFILEYQALFYI